MTGASARWRRRAPWHQPMKPQLCFAPKEIAAIARDAPNAGAGVESDGSGSVRLRTPTVRHTLPASGLVVQFRRSSSSQVACQLHRPADGPDMEKETNRHRAQLRQRRRHRDSIGRLASSRSTQLPELSRSQSPPSSLTSEQNPGRASFCGVACAALACSERTRAAVVAVLIIPNGHTMKEEEKQCQI